jgi:hypothetical protein
MGFSDYIIYADESGDHGLASINPEMPVFVLAFCIFRKEDYIRSVVPSVQTLKFKYWGHDGVILHNHEIRKRKGEFNILKNQPRAEGFFDDLNVCLINMPVTVIAAVIDKLSLAKLIPSGLHPNPYYLALGFCVAELRKFLNETAENGTKTFIIAERRGAEEDKLLAAEFAKIDAPGPALELRFMDKKHNSTGLQIADLVAHPIARHSIHPDQPNRAFSILKNKLYAVGNITWRTR